MSTFQINFVCYFLVDYDTIDKSDMLNIHKI